MLTAILYTLSTALLIGSFLLIGFRPFGGAVPLGLLCLIVGILLIRHTIRHDPANRGEYRKDLPPAAPKPAPPNPEASKPVITVTSSLESDDNDGEPVYCYPRVHIAGTRYHEAAADLMVGDELEVIPDPDNEHDPDAVGVYRADDGELVGFIHRDSRHKQMVLDYYPRDDWYIEAEVSDVVDDSKIYMELRFYRL